MRFLIALLLSFLPILGAKQKGEDIDLPQGQVHEGDYFATGRNVRIFGVVKGDLYAFGADITVNGRVEGDIIASGNMLQIGGDILGSARLAGNEIVLSGSVARNCTIMGKDIQMMQGSLIGGNGVFMGKSIDLSGDITGKATLTGSNVRIAGKIEGNTKASVGSLLLGSNAELNGNLEYRSGKSAIIDPGATIRGNVAYNPSKFFAGHWKETLLFGSLLAGISMNFVFSFILGLILVKWMPERLRNALSALRTRPIKAFFMGLLVFILLPIICILLFMTLIGIPVALALFAFSLILFYAAKIVPIIWCSNAIFAKYNDARTDKLGPVWILLFGLILYFLVTRIPLVGGLISFVFTFLGLGCLVFSRHFRPAKRV